VAGVYISWPFCAQKCTYCNFASGVFPRELEAAYLAALRREIAAHAWAWTPETVYLGGGTPGSMGPALEDVLSSVPGRPWREATLEAAPGAIQPEDVELWRRAGINRVSLGVQSFVENELRRTGRRHTAEGVAHDVAMLRAAGLTNFNLDLIAGLPGQTLESWKTSLDWIERLEPAHVSVYMLEVDEDSNLGKELLAGGARYGAGAVPSEEVITDLYELAVDRLAGLGLARYEISNFARPGAESLHNLKYWQLAPYAGFGADAHGFDGALRTRNVESPREYAQAAHPRCETTPAHPGEERFFVGLRLLSGIVPTAEEWARHAEAIGRFLDEGLLEREGGRLRLTRRGVLLSNDVFAAFLED